jgi:hypothetical protein
MSNAAPRIDLFTGSYPQQDDVGAALPTSIIGQMFTAESIAALRALNEHMPALVLLAVEPAVVQANWCPETHGFWRTAPTPNC